MHAEKIGHSPSGFRSECLVSILLSLLIASVALLFAIEQISDYDIWRHLKTGQWILEHNAIPHADPFTIATPNATWQPHYWLSDVFFCSNFPHSRI